MTTIISGSSPSITFSDSTTQSTTAPSTSTFGFKNRIINGGMVIAQRGTSATNPLNATATPAYTTIDRLGAWADTALQTSWTIQQSSNAPTGFSSSALITSTSASSLTTTTYETINQSIEAFNTSDLLWGTANAKACTFSFWVKCSLTGTFSGYVYNSGYGYSYPFTYSIPTANTWTFITISIPGPTGGTWLSNTNGVGLQVGLSIAVGSSYQGTANTWQSGSFIIGASGAVNMLTTNGSTFYTTGWQFEVGTQATSFDFRDYGSELILCQRYLYAISYGGSTYAAIASGYCESTTQGRFAIPFPVQARTAPTGLTASSASHFSTFGSTGAFALSSFVFEGGTLNSAYIDGNITSGLTVGHGVILAVTNASAKIYFTGCEL